MLEKLQKLLTELNIKYDVLSTKTVRIYLPDYFVAPITVNEDNTFSYRGHTASDLESLKTILLDNIS